MRRTLSFESVINIGSIKRILLNEYIRMQYHRCAPTAHRSEKINPNNHLSGHTAKWTIWMERIYTKEPHQTAETLQKKPGINGDAGRR